MSRIEKTRKLLKDKILQATWALSTFKYNQNINFEQLQDESYNLESVMKSIYDWETGLKEQTDSIAINKSILKKLDQIKEFDDDYEVPETDYEDNLIQETDDEDSLIQEANSEKIPEKVQKTFNFKNNFVPSNEQDNSKTNNKIEQCKKNVVKESRKKTGRMETIIPQNKYDPNTWLPRKSRPVFDKKRDDNRTGYKATKMTAE